MGNKIIYKQFVPAEEQAREKKAGIVRSRVLCQIIRAFFVHVGDAPAPPRAMQPGEKIMLDRRDAVENFLLGRILPLEPAVAGGEYIITRNELIVHDGVYKKLHFGDIVLLNQAEAVNFLRRRLARPVDEVAFSI